jgi:hypothetical protein
MVAMVEILQQKSLLTQFLTCTFSKQNFAGRDSFDGRFW